MAYRPGKCRLHHILRENNLTLTDLSKKTGIRLSQLSDYANNHRESMSYANAFNIAMTLGIPMEDLYEAVEY
jgi:transcriptional regulator with XRE-family HTH domain